jgi:hypothetical protein
MSHTCGDAGRRLASAKARQGSADIIINKCYNHSNYDSRASRQLHQESKAEGTLNYATDPKAVDRPSGSQEFPELRKF